MTAGSPRFSGELLAERRREAKFTQADLAECVTAALRQRDPKSGRVWPQDVSRWECGVNKPGTDAFIAVCHVLRCEIDDLSVTEEAA